MRTPIRLLAVVALATAPGASGATDANPDLGRSAYIDLELRAMEPQLEKSILNLSALTLDQIPAFRKGLGEPDSRRLPGVPVSERLIPGPNGAPKVRLVIINAGKKGEARPVIVHMHGGGFILGSARSDNDYLQRMAQALDCVIVSIDYRLAPEATYRESVEDNYSGLVWTSRHADELGADPRRLALFGVSAGGGHAALLAIAARDRGEVPVLFQALVYPMLDDRTGTSVAAPAHIGRYVWTAGPNALGWEAFLGRAPGGPDVPDAAVPARNRNLSGLPPTFIQVGGADLFASEDIEFARRLNEAGVATELQLVPGAFHGFDFFAPDANVSKRFTEARLTAFRRAFERAR